jgi:glycosyltransferase involved in cell wall biosynthesis
MKGFPVLLRASRRLLEMGLSHKVKIYGDGPDRKRLGQMIEAMGLEATVELMGHYDPNGIRAALLHADIFVLPAVFDRVERTMDGIPVSLIEAMSVGTPVISTTISGIPELIEHGVNGYLAVPGDPESLAEAILRWHCLREVDRKQILVAARKKIELDHDVQKLSSVLKRDLLGCLRIAGGGKGCAE